MNATQATVSYGVPRHTSLGHLAVGSGSLASTVELRPRSESEDPLLPNHILDRRKLVPVPISERDRQVFDVLIGGGSGEVTLSRSQRSTEGATLSASALWPPMVKPRTRTRTRIPGHAFSEADRLLARPRKPASLLDKGHARLLAELASKPVHFARWRGQGWASGRGTRTGSTSFCNLAETPRARSTGLPVALRDWNAAGAVNSATSVT